MSVFFRRRGTLTIAVTITGAGNASRCYAIINGTTQYEAGTHEVNAGDTITFGLAGALEGYSKLTIDGTEVLRLQVTSIEVKTYDWIVPDGISTVEIAMLYNNTDGNRITVTTA